MNKNNLIRFAQSLVFFPLMASVSLSGSLPQAQIAQNVLSQKFNITDSSSLLAVGAVEDTKIKTLELEAGAIDAYFKANHAPLEGEGMEMAQVADQYDLDWRLLPAIAMRESTAGIHECTTANHNFFGWDSCNVSFDSDDQAIEALASNLSGNDPDTAKYYKGKDTEQILREYNDYIKEYPQQVMKIMDTIATDSNITSTSSNSNA